MLFLESLKKFIYRQQFFSFNSLYIDLNLHQSKKLPNYMMPSEIYFIKNNFPRNENGKIDKKALLNLIDKQ